MSILSLLHILSFAALLWLMFYALYKNPKALLNRLCSLLIFSFAMWNFVGALLQSSKSEGAAAAWLNIASIGWCSFAVLWLYFTIVFTKGERIFRKWFIYPALLLLPLLFIYKQWAGFLLEKCSRQAHGWSFVWADSTWPYLFYSYYILCAVISFYLCFDMARRTKLLYEKKQAGLILITSLSSIILGTITNVMLPALEIYTIPPMAPILSLIFAGGIVYSITKYKLMTITTAAAAEDIISTMVDPLVLVDTEGRIVKINRAAIDLLGYKEEEIIGKPVEILFAEEEQLFEGTKWEKLLKEGSIRDYSMICITKTGQKIPVSFSSSVMKDKEGNMVGIVGIARDMRETKKFQAQLMRSGKLAAIGELASGLAHEIGNPLQTILGNVDLLLMDNKTEELQSIKDASLHCKKIIQNLLDFSRQKEMNFVLEDINNILENTLLLYGKQLELKKVKIVKNYGELPKISISPSHIEQVFLNIITNAQKAMPNGGTLTITTCSGGITISQNMSHSNATATGEPSFIEISFKDTGIGISKENLPLVFEQFFTTKKDGTGLGLPISQEIIKQHVGEIFAFSDGEGKGAEFIVRLDIKKNGDDGGGVKSIKI